MYPRKKAGTRNVAIQNAFVRTRSRYSRRMTAKTFLQLIFSSLDRPGLFDPGGADGVEIDLLELGLLRREPQQLVSVEGPSQEFPEIGPRGQSDEITAVDGLGRGDPGQRRNLLWTRLNGQLEQVARESALQIPEIALEDLLRARHEADLVAEFLGLLEDVRRKDDGFPLLPEIAQVFLDDRGVDRIEAGERLV